MRQFITRHEKDIRGTLSGFDRIRFRGTIRWLSSLPGMRTFLCDMRVRFTEFKAWAQSLTSQIVQASEKIAQTTAEKRVIYLPSSKHRKDELALEQAEKHNVREGLICVLQCVEPCHTFKVKPNPQIKRLELRQEFSKCSHFYFYVRHPQYGLLHLRLQSWLPFTIHACMNGREWLAQELHHRKIGFHQRDNCFVWIKDLVAAQELADQQLRTDWTGLLNSLRQAYHPVHETMFG